MNIKRHKPVRMVSGRLKPVQRGTLPTTRRAVRRPTGSYSEPELKQVPNPVTVLTNDKETEEDIQLPSTRSLSLKTQANL